MVRRSGTSSPRPYNSNDVASHIRLRITPNSLDGRRHELPARQPRRLEPIADGPRGAGALRDLADAADDRQQG